MGSQARVSYSSTGPWITESDAGPNMHLIKGDEGLRPEGSKLWRVVVFADVPVTADYIVRADDEAEAKRRVEEFVADESGGCDCVWALCDGLSNAVADEAREISDTIKKTDVARLVGSILMPNNLSSPEDKIKRFMEALDQTP